MYHCRIFTHILLILSCVLTRERERQRETEWETERCLCLQSQKEASNWEKGKLWEEPLLSWVKQIVAYFLLDFHVCYLIFMPIHKGMWISFHDLKEANKWVEFSFCLNLIKFLLYVLNNLVDGKFLYLALMLVNCMLLWHSFDLLCCLSSHHTLKRNWQFFLFYDYENDLSALIELELWNLNLFFFCQKLEQTVAAGKKLASLEEREHARMDAFRVAVWNWDFIVKFICLMICKYHTISLNSNT